MRTVRRVLSTFLNFVFNCGKSDLSADFFVCKYILKKERKIELALPRQSQICAKSLEGRLADCVGFQNAEIVYNLGDNILVFNSVEYDI